MLNVLCNELLEELGVLTGSLVVTKLQGFHHVFCSAFGVQVLHWPMGAMFQDGFHSNPVWVTAKYNLKTAGGSKF